MQRSTRCPRHRAKRKHFASDALAVLLVLLFIDCLSPFANAQTATDNSYRVRHDETVTFRSEANFDLSEEGTIEFWVKHLWGANDIQLRPDENFEFARRSRLEVPCAVLIAAGTEEELDFAIYLRQALGNEPASMLGIANSFEDLGTTAMMKELSQTDSVGESPLRFARAQFYHVAIVRPRGRQLVDVYVNGIPQGSMKGSLADFTGKPLHVGWQYGPKTRALDEDKRTVAQIVPFEGEIAGLRIWKSALSANSINSLMEFGRSPEPQALALISEYSDLAAWSDFRGIRWDEKTRRWTEDRVPRLRPADPLAGCWRAANAVVTRRGNTGNYVDYPVYTFISRDGSGVTEPIYDVFEDAVNIGLMYREQGQDSHSFVFQHKDPGWPKIQMAKRHVINPSNGRRTLRLSCRVNDLPRPLAGVRRGTLTLTRSTLEELRTPTFSKTQFKDALEKNQAKLRDPGTSVFLASNNVRYRNTLYGGYNVPRMDGIDLFKTGVQNTQPIFMIPESDLFTLDTNQIRLMPPDLGIDNKNAGLTTSTSTYVSDSLEFSDLLNERTGAGWSMNASVTATAEVKVLGSGGSVSGTVGTTVSRSWQQDNLLDSIAMNSSADDLLVRRSTFQHYTLYHKKEAMRLSHAFRTAVLELYALASKEPTPESRRALMFEFFDRWGTHYSFATTFGAITWSETVVDERTRNVASKDTYIDTVNLNGGIEGSEKSFGYNFAASLKNARTTARSIGGRSAGTEHSAASPDDEPNPISVDLRPIDTVLSPQYFPSKPQVYGQLRNWVAEAYVHYCIHNMENALAELEAKLNRGKLRIGKNDSPWRGTEITSQDLWNYRENLKIYTQSLKWPQKERGDIFWIRLKKITGDSPNVSVKVRFGAGLIPNKNWKWGQPSNPKPGLMGFIACTRAGNKTPKTVTETLTSIVRRDAVAGRPVLGDANGGKIVKTGEIHWLPDPDLTRRVEELNRKLGEQTLFNNRVPFNNGASAISSLETAMCNLPRDAARNYVYAYLEVRSAGSAQGQDVVISPVLKMVNNPNLLERTSEYNNNPDNHPCMYFAGALNPNDPKWRRTAYSPSMMRLDYNNRWSKNLFRYRRQEPGSTLIPGEVVERACYSGNIVVYYECTLIPNVSEQLSGDLLDTKRIVSSDPKWGEFRPGPSTPPLGQGASNRSTSISFEPLPYLDPAKVYTRDFSGGGKADILVAAGNPWQLYVAEERRWVPFKALPAPPNRDRLGMADFDGDKAFLTGIPPAELRFADFDGDQQTDVLRVSPEGLRVLYAGHGKWNLVGESADFASLSSRP